MKKKSLEALIEGILAEHVSSLTAQDRGLLAEILSARITSKFYIIPYSSQESFE
jgi:hypothetical protein